MKTPQDGGPAFPFPAFENRQGRIIDWGAPGMTLLQYYGAEAMKAVWADQSAHVQSRLAAKTDIQAVDMMCHAAWTLAERMLVVGQQRAKEREQKEGQP